MGYELKLRTYLRLVPLVIVVIVIILVVSNESEGAIAASHSHQRNDRRSPSREREADGAYSPKDKSHYESSDHGQGHHSEFDHEAIIGSTKEAEEFDNLSPEEAKARLRVLVGKMDLDKNGQIEKGELKAWIIRSFKMLSEEESNDKLQEVDEDEDGRVTWKEYVQEMFGIDLDKGSSIPMDDLDEQQMFSDDKQLFAVADSNRDGYLDAKEFLSFTHPEEDPKMLPVVYQQTLDSKDTNKDGEIDFKEFIGDRGQDKDKAWLEQEKDRFDEELDTNKDGLLNRQEIISWVLPSNEEIAEDEVTHLFAATDDNHDEVLSLEEILEHHDTFVGSEATDYGDHLHNLEKFKDEL